MCKHHRPTGQLSRKQFAKKQREAIEHHGHQVIAVFGDESRPPWAYTVGRAAAGKVELLITGLPSSQGARILNDVAAWERANGIDIATLATTPTFGVQLDGYKVELRLAPCDPEASKMNVALNAVHDLKACQVLWPDAAGRWPEDPGFEDIQDLYTLNSWPKSV